MKKARYKTGQLLVQLGHLVTCFRNQKLQSQELTSGQAGILGCLRRHTGEGVTAGELVREMGRSKATLSEMLKAMEKKNLIRRCEDPEDGRKIRIYLTEQGWSKEEKLRKVAEENEQIILRGMSETERREFDRLLKIALANMNQSKQMDL